MSCYIGQYVKTCDLCLHTKAQQHLPVRELSPLPILESCWETISIDFIVKLPESHGNDVIMNVVDSVSKVSHFIPTHTTITALGVARLFLTHIWKLHRLLKQVISDRGLQFIAELTRELYRLLGIKLAATMAYHPQGDRRRSGSTRSWNSISTSLSTRGRMTGMNCFCWQSSSTTTMYTLPHSKLPSC